MQALDGLQLGSMPEDKYMISLLLVYEDNVSDAAFFSDTAECVILWTEGLCDLTRFTQRQ